MDDPDHTHNGNCWKNAYSCDDCGEGEFCDACHEHDESRGECSECEPCEACDFEDRDEDVLVG